MTVYLDVNVVSESYIKMGFLNRCCRRFYRKMVLIKVELFTSVFVILLAAHVVSANSDCPPCSTDDIMLTKSTCQRKGVHLEESQSTRNSTIVCSALHDLFICIAEHIPQCLEKVGSEYENYTGKPWNCSVEQYIQQYQAIVHSGCQLKAGYKPVKSADHSSYKMADDERQNSTSDGISRHGCCWLSFMISVTLGIIVQISEHSQLETYSTL